MHRGGECAQLQHVAERNDQARSGCRRAFVRGVERGAHGARIGIVGVVDYQQAAERAHLQAPGDRRDAFERAGDGGEFVRRKPARAQCGGGRDGRRRIARRGGAEQRQRGLQPRWRARGDQPRAERERHARPAVAGGAGGWPARAPRFARRRPRRRRRLRPGRRAECAPSPGAPRRRPPPRRARC